MMGSGVISAMYSVLRSGVICSSLVHRVLSVATCAHIWICAWNTLVAGHLTTPRFETVLYRYDDMCAVVGKALGCILNRQSGTRGLEQGENIYFHLVEALADVVRTTPVATSAHKSVVDLSLIHI